MKELSQISINYPPERLDTQLSHKLWLDHFQFLYAE